MAVSVGRVLGDAEMLLGHREPAEALYRVALEDGAKIGFRPEIALANLGLAEVFLKHDAVRRSEAAGHLDFAIGEFQEMKMQPSLERALKHKGLLHA